MISMSNAIFVLFASILVFSMTPGLAFFYGGQKRRQYDDFNFFDLRNWNFTVYQLRIWAVLQQESFWNYRKFFLSGVNLMKPFGTAHIPLGVDIIFQLMFALVTPALFVGATVGRMKFSYLITFVCVWTLVVYYPLVHIIWSPAGLLAQHGLLDFAWNDFLMDRLVRL